MQIYPWQIDPPSQSHIDALNTATPKLADLLANLPPSQLSIDALNTTTPNMVDLLAQISVKP